MNRRITRREMLHRAAGAAAVTAGLDAPLAFPGVQEAAAPPLNRNSAPSDLKITDMRACTVAANYDYPIIRIDTNQGVYGLGEVRDAGVKGIALILKAHILGKNPLEIEPVLANVRQFAGQGRMGGGYSAVDMALHDIAGKVYGVPAWRLLGHKRRDRIRIYCDTTGHKDPKVYGERMLKRKKMGFTFFKMDLYTSLVADRPGAVHQNGAATEKGLAYLCEYIQAVRDAIGWDTPLAADHFGRLSVNDCIRYARAFEPYQLAWAEDFISYKDWRGYKTISDATTTPILTGEDAFGLEEGFQSLLDNHAVDIIHPDPETSGALIETKRIADYADMHGIPTALHFAGSPVGCMASVHLAATLRNFIVMENHAVDMPWWGDLVTGPSKPIIQDGYIPVPDTPGLGVELNEAVVKEHLRYPGYFEPTPMFDDFIVSGFRMVGPWPHYDEDGNYVNKITY
ncbi:MAG: mandelate racemase/muconate lactonizing enzyme family protein [Acidobacteria bacterium]|nr:mandelate racemase/muconate lactonizing enzyme family protein [Acidobacteriota bacterium]